MKELIGKMTLMSSKLPQKITVNKVDLFDQIKIAHEFNSFLANIGKNLASKVPNASTSFKYFANKSDFVVEIKLLSMNELKDAFYSFKGNKSPGYGDISCNVVKKCIRSLFEPLKYLFNFSIEKNVFTDDLKIARVTPIYKGEDKSDVGNYRPIFVLPCFPKILERVMCNRLYKYLIQSNILYSKQLGFQNGHSTDHAVVQLVDQIIESFENNKYTLGVFIDLSKAFDTVDHSILLKKLELYGITDRNHGWLKSYLSNRRQFFQSKLRDDQL